MKKLTYLALICIASLQSSSCDIIRGAMNNPNNTTYRCVPMTQGEFGPYHSRVASKTFANDRLEAAKQGATRGGCLTANQIGQITSLIDFEFDRVKYAKHAYPLCADPANYGIINNYLDHESSKRELNQLTGVN